MKAVSFTEFRKNASSLFDEVEGGGTIRVYRHGKAVADVVPAAEGEMAPSWRKRGLRLIIPGAALSEAVLDARRQEP